MKSIVIEKWLEEKTGYERYTPGLTRVKTIIDHLFLYPTSKCIIVAGTNGKGGVTRLLGKTLQQKYHTAFFTSPHILSINERFDYDGELISTSDLFRYLNFIHSTSAELKVNLTYFEIIFVAFLYWCKERGWPDYMVLEVGLGGRLDATNVIDSDLALITSISRDHQDILGNRYDLILHEKLGVAKTDKTVITSFKLEYLRNLTDKYCQLNNVKHLSFPNNENFHMNNISFVQAAIEALGLKLKPVVFFNNFKIKCNDKFLLCYGSHNPDAVRKLVHFLAEEHYNNHDNKFELLVLSFSKRSETDIRTMLSLYKTLLGQCVQKIVVTSFEHPKAMDRLNLKRISGTFGIEFIEHISSETIKEKNILCSGSNYFFRSFYDSLCGSGI